MMFGWNSMVFQQSSKKSFRDRSELLNYSTVTVTLSKIKSWSAVVILQIWHGVRICTVFVSISWNELKNDKFREQTRKPNLEFLRQNSNQKRLVMYSIKYSHIIWAKIMQYNCAFCFFVVIWEENKLSCSLWTFPTAVSQFYLRNCVKD